MFALALRNCIQVKPGTEMPGHEPYKAEPVLSHYIYIYVCRLYHEVEVST